MSDVTRLKGLINQPGTFSGEVATVDDSEVYVSTQRGIVKATNTAGFTLVSGNRVQVEGGVITRVLTSKTQSLPRFEL